MSIFHRRALLIIHCSMTAVLCSIVAVSCNMGQQPKPDFLQYYDLYSIGADGSGQKHLAENANAFFLVTHDAIIYADRSNGIIQMNHDGSNFQKRYSWLPDISLTSSHDGANLLLASIPMDFSSTNFYLISPDGNNLQQKASIGEFVWQAQISPDLSEIVYTSRGNIKTLGLNDSRNQLIRSVGDSSVFPSFTYFYDDHTIIYGGSTDSLPVVGIIDIETKAEKIATTGFPTDPYGRILSGTRLLIADRGLIKTIDLSSLEITTLAEGWDASFSNDGTFIVFSNGRTISIMNSDGSNPRAVYTETDAKRSIENPKLTPDNRNIIYCSVYTEYR